MTYSVLTSKRLKIVLLVLLLFVAVPTQSSKIRKDEQIVDKVTDDIYISKGDIEGISQKLNWWFLSLVGFIGLEIYRAYQKRDDKTADTLKELVTAVERMEIRLEQTPTKEEARIISRDEVLHARTLQG